MKRFSAFVDSLKKAPIIFGILLFYLGAGIFAAAFHGTTGSFASVTGANPTIDSVTNTVVGQIFVPEGDETASADGSGGSSSDDGSVITNEDGTLPSDTESSDALSGELTAGAEEQHYYRYTVVTRIHRLHLRTGPGLTYEIIDWQPKGTTGYVIQPGADWSYLKPDDKNELGYSFNGYLELTEIAPEDYPEDLKGVTPPIPL